MRWFFWAALALFAAEVGAGSATRTPEDTLMRVRRSGVVEGGTFAACKRAALVAPFGFTAQESPGQSTAALPCDCATAP
jgi:hypothetical protein